jgi:hypothetical protein
MRQIVDLLRRSTADMQGQDLPEPAETWEHRFIPLPDQGAQ